MRSVRAVCGIPPWRTLATQVGTGGVPALTNIGPARQDGPMVEQSDNPPTPGARPPSSTGGSDTELDPLRRLVAPYVEAGAEESVQRVITAVHRVSRRLNQWYDQQLADIDVSTGEWAVLSELARADGNDLTPTRLAAAAHVAPSSMTHRLDRMVGRDLVDRTPDPGNRTRILVSLTARGWELYRYTIAESNLVESDLMMGLTDRQVDNLAYLLEKLLAGLDAGLLRPPRRPGSGRTGGAAAD
ncbi:MAG: MarR family winged helix-turn-helix transcriptional regulator [Microlunatus sp.]|nr:MarR family winged helix-turn-helix transcriptional regulator [Microlunatus sp.]